MKSISYYGKALILFCIVMFSLLFMNVVSAFMMLRLGQHKDDETVSECPFLPVVNFAEPGIL